MKEKNDKLYYDKEEKVKFSRFRRGIKWLTRSSPKYDYDEQLRRQGIVQLHRRQVETGLLLGSGGFARVFQVTAIKKKEFEGKKVKYELKVLDENLLEDDAKFRKSALDMVVETQHLIRCIGHPYIIQIRGVSIKGTESAAMARKKSIDRFFVVTDQVEDNLHERLIQWKYGRDNSSATNDLEQLIQKTKYAYQIMQALKFLHERRLVFRNLKPENVGILVEEEDQPHYRVKNAGPKNERVQLQNFALCRELPPEPVNSDEIDCGEMLTTLFGAGRKNDGNDGFYSLSDISGSPRYMAGEVAIAKHYNLKCDIYSWAITFYEMLAVRPAFGQLSLEELREDVWKEGHRPALSKSNELKDIPRSIAMLIKQSWSRYPVRRPTSEECCERLECILDGLEKKLKRSKKGD